MFEKWWTNHNIYASMNEIPNIKESMFTIMITQSCSFMFSSKDLSLKALTLFNHKFTAVPVYIKGKSDVLFHNVTVSIIVFENCYLFSFNNNGNENYFLTKRSMQFFQKECGAISKKTKLYLPTFRTWTCEITSYLRCLEKIK